MVHSMPFSPIEERWVEISDFPLYLISDRGRIIRTDIGPQGREVTVTTNTRGIPIVGLMRDNRQAKRAVNVLVATAFVPKPSSAAFDSVINLNGDRADNQYTNLMWRPLWFARKYTRQFNEEHATFDDPIEDVETGITYKDSYSAAIHHGLLEQEIVMSMSNNTYVWPTGQIFREVIDR